MTPMTAETDPKRATSASEGVEYSLAELSEISGVPSRTIRYYQANGVLPKPARRGNQAFYSAAHADRLAAIAELQSRGLQLRAIRSMFQGSTGPTHVDSDVVNLLGPELAGSAWLRSSARTLDEGELADLLGDAYPEQVSEFVKAGYLERRLGPDGRGVWYANSLPQLRGALEMLKLGTDVALSGWSADLMRQRFRELCEDFAHKWVSEAGNLYAGEGKQEEFEANLETIRSVVWQSAAHVIAEEIEQVIRRIDDIRASMAANKEANSETRAGDPDRRQPAVAEP
jgi:DNA-binding transcriptional MerR regulator